MAFIQKLNDVHFRHNRCTPTGERSKPGTPRVPTPYNAFTKEVPKKFSVPVDTLERATKGVLKSAEESPVYFTMRGDRRRRLEKRAGLQSAPEPARPARISGGVVPTPPPRAPPKRHGFKDSPRKWMGPVGFKKERPDSRATLDAMRASMRTAREKRDADSGEARAARRKQRDMSERGVEDLKGGARSMDLRAALNSPRRTKSAKRSQRPTMSPSPGTLTSHADNLMPFVRNRASSSAGAGDGSGNGAAGKKERQSKGGNEAMFRPTTPQRKVENLKLTEEMRTKDSSGRVSPLTSPKRKDSKGRRQISGPGYGRVNHTGKALTMPSLEKVGESYDSSKLAKEEYLPQRDNTRRSESGIPLKKEVTSKIGNGLSSDGHSAVSGQEINFDIVRKVFSILDSDKSGELDVVELQQGLQMLKLNSTKGAVREMLKRAQLIKDARDGADDGDGTQKHRSKRGSQVFASSSKSSKESRYASSSGCRDGAMAQ